MRPVRLVAVGDIMPGDSATCVGWGTHSRWPGHQFDRVLQPTTHLFAAADLVIGNLESPLTKLGIGTTTRQRDQMRASPDVAVELARAGFDVLSVANNHAMQHGLSGFLDTVDALRTAGIAVIGLRGDEGWCSMPVTRTLEGLKIGLLAYCWRPPQYHEGAAPFAEGTVDQAIMDVARLTQTCDAVVVSLHWGDEFVEQPSVEQEHAAERLCLAGASIILGHHSHVAQTVRQDNGTVVAYSLGNFSSDMLWMEETRNGLIITCEITSERCALAEIHGVRTQDDLTLRLVDARLKDSLAFEQTDRHRSLVGSALRRQRAAAYLYTIKNLYRFQPSVAFDLLASTLQNRLESLGRRRER